MNLVRKNLSKFIEGAILLTLGILFIILGATKDNGGARDAVSIIIAIVLLIVGVLSLVLVIWAGVKSKASFAAVGVTSAVLIGVAISLLDKKWAVDIVTFILFVLPYVLICVGAVIIADGILVLVRTLRAKGAALPAVLTIVTGAVALTIGCLCIGDNPVIKQDAQLVIFGIIVVVLAAISLLTTVVNANKK